MAKSQSFTQASGCRFSQIKISSWAQRCIANGVNGYVQALMVGDCHQVHIQVLDDARRCWMTLGATPFFHDIFIPMVDTERFPPAPRVAGLVPSSLVWCRPLLELFQWPHVTHGMWPIGCTRTPRTTRTWSNAHPRSQFSCLGTWQMPSCTLPLLGNILLRQ